MLDMLPLYLSMPFVQNALVAGVLIALSSSLLGVTLVLKRFSFMGDSLSHVAFLAMALAGVLHFAVPMQLIMPITIVCAVLMLCAGNSFSQQGDAMLAMVSVGTLAIGYLVMNLFSTGNVSSDVCTTLFGSTSILTLKSADVWTCVVMSVLVVLLFVLCYHKIFAITFDEDFCRATGVHVKAYSVLIAVITAVIIVLSMELVGSLLTSALIIFPALCAMRVFRSFFRVVICSAVISVVCAAAGILIAILFSTPVGSTIVAAECICFVICSIIGRLCK